MSAHSNQSSITLNRANALHDSHSEVHTNGWALSTEELIAHNSHQLTNPGQYPLDPALTAAPPLGHDGVEAHHGALGLRGSALRTASPADVGVIEDKENKGFDGTMDDETAADGSRRKKGSSSSQANDVELRRLFRENQSRDLREVAIQVVQDDKGPKSEKTKQIFGMLWYACHHPLQGAQC